MAARRLEKARAAVVAQEAVVRFEAELQEGLQRLEDLKAATVPTYRPPVDPASTTYGPGGRSLSIAGRSDGVDWSGTVFVHEFRQQRQSTIHPTLWP